MRDMRKRLYVLEKLPQFQPPPTPLQQIKTRVIQQTSNEDLDLMMIMTRDLEAGMDRTLSDREAVMWNKYNAACETEALRMGFKSFAQAQRMWGHL